MNKADIILLALIYFLTNAAYAQQPGYIITQRNDTARGEFKTSAFSRPKFKAINSSTSQTVNLDTIKEYQLTKDSSVFIAKVLPKSSMNFIAKPQFVQWLERGKINLYEQVGTDSYHLRTWYVSKNTDSLIAIKTDDIFLVGKGSKKDRIAVFENMLSDEPDILTAFKAEKFDFDTIYLYIKRYNSEASAAMAK